MLDSLDNGKDEKGKPVKTTQLPQQQNWPGKKQNHKKIRSDCLEKEEEEEPCQGENMCPRNGGNLHGLNLKLGKSCLKMIPDGSGKLESDVFLNVKQKERTKCAEQECCRDSPQISRMTGSSCQALKCAVSTLHRLDDFNMEKIGSGFFSEVFKVTHKVTGCVMVLKMNLLRSNRPNMLKEVQLMNQLKHQNILNFRGVCVHEGQLHALTEYINGGSLEQLIQSRNVDLPYLTRQELALDIARGMEYLHGKGVFHRDLTSKNVLIKKSDDGSMMAVVGDFGLAAKIPDPKCKYRLPTVGSAYWMSPECLKGQWYNEKSDIFSYGIVLCEMIARIEADPDILPRTDNFGLDYLAFSELCGPCPPHFLKLAFSCSTFEPKSRPSFTEIVKTLERLIPEYEDLVKKEAEAAENVKILNAGSLNSLIDATEKSAMTARSEEVINNCNSSPKDIIHSRKLHHRRSLSEDVANIVFPRHTAPSDKARCHYLSTREVLANPKFIGESMCQADPHYKPRVSGEKGSRSNPFLALSQFRGAKKIVASQNLNTSKDSSGAARESPTLYFHNNDLFSSCFELPSPFYGITPPSSPVTGSSFDEKSKKNISCCSCSKQGCDYKSESGLTPTESEGKKPTRKLFPSEDVPNSGNQYLESSISSPKTILCCRHQKTPCGNGKLSGDSSLSYLSFRKADESSDRRRSFPPNSSTSLPSSPTSQRKSNLFAQEEKQSFHQRIPKKLTKSRTVPLIEKGDGDSEKTEADGGRGQSSSSSSRHLSPKLIFHGNLAETRGPAQNPEKKPPETELASLVTNRISTSSTNLLEGTADETFLIASSVQLKRRSSCESGFFSCVGEDYGVTGSEMLSSCEYVLQSARQKHLDNSSATLSSSSAASSLFLLDDSLSTTTVSSLRSGSGDFNDLDDLPSRFAHHSILFSAKRPPSSVITDSSEDISSLGDLDDRTQSRYQSHQISKIVEYFERKQTGSGMMATRSESCSGKFCRRNFANVEFQKNIQRFDPPKASEDNNKIKWDGLEGKFKKSGMGLTQRKEHPEERRAKGNDRGRKFGPQNAAESPHHHEACRKFEGGCSISDAIRKSKIELLRKSLERGTLQVPGINPSLSTNSGVSSTPTERNLTRPLATRLMICEGAVKSKLPLFDKNRELSLYSSRTPSSFGFPPDLAFLHSRRPSLPEPSGFSTCTPSGLLPSTRLMSRNMSATTFHVLPPSGQEPHRSSLFGEGASHVRLQNPARETVPQRGRNSDPTEVVPTLRGCIWDSSADNAGERTAQI